MCFSQDSRFLFSVGGNDRTALIWEVKGAPDLKAAEDVSELEEDYGIEVPEGRRRLVEEKEVDAFEEVETAGD